MDKKNIDGLVKACKKGNRLAQIQIYDLYCEAMFATACQYLKNEEDAKDTMQESFLKAFTKIDDYRNTFSFGIWLKRIVINSCIDFLRKKTLQLEPLEVNNTQMSEPDNWNFDINITKQNILYAIEHLKTPYQLIIKLYLLEGYDHEEISDILSIPIKTSRTRLHRAKIHLRNALKLNNHETRY